MDAGVDVAKCGCGSMVKTREKKCVLDEERKQ
jgi:hypothetical protein